MLFSVLRYSLNSGHSKFTKIYKAVFPNGLNSYPTPAGTRDPTPATSRNASTANLSSLSSSAVSAKSASKGSFFSRLTGGSAGSTPSGSTLNIPGTVDSTAVVMPEGETEDLIVYGAAFGDSFSLKYQILANPYVAAGFGLFNLVFSLLPAKIKYVFIRYQ